MNQLVFDLEILRAIPARGFNPADDDSCGAIQYCNGWDDFAGMGVAVACGFDVQAIRPRVWLRDNELALHAAIAGADQIIGFNTIRFDNRVLAAAGFNINRPGLDHYDLLREIWIGLGLDPDKFNPRTHGGLSLGAVCAANGLPVAKTGDGARAPIRFQSGFVGEVIDYCLNDVMMTYALFEHVSMNDFSLQLPGGRSVKLRNAYQNVAIF